MVEIGGKEPLEKYLRSLGITQNSPANLDIAQIDKLARYLHICKDLLKIVRQPAYRPLFHNITLEPLESYSEIRRPGTAKLCHVHPEIQQVFYYARHHHDPLPRVIGCSKSVCYLCDLFLKQQGSFRVSHSHQRLYSQWTLPDVDWMTPDQAERFSNIVKTMTKHIKNTEEELRWQSPPMRPQWRPYGIESRAYTRLSSGLTPSDAQNGKSIPSSTTTTTLPPRVRANVRSRSASRPRALTPDPRQSRNVSRPPPLSSLTSKANSEQKRDASQPPMGEQDRARERRDSITVPSQRSISDRSSSRTPLIPDEARARPVSRPPPVRRNTRERTASRPDCARKRRRDDSGNSSKGVGALSVTPRTAGAGARTIVLQSSELPFQHDVKENEPPLTIEIDAVSLLVEFPAQSAGRLYISKKDPKVTGKTDINVFEIPTEGGLTLSNGPRSSLVVFQLRHSALTRLNIGFHWGSMT